MKSAIIAEKISYAYEEPNVIQNASFQIQEKEFIGIIGPNGGGKTTLLKLMMGLLIPKEGKLNVFDKLPKQVRQQIAYVPQVLHFDKQFPISVYEVVLSGRLAHLPWYGIFQQKDHNLASEMMETLGIADLKSRAFGTLSGGQAQRTLIARALVSHPEILILDEPTTSVDTQAEAEIYSLLQDLKGKMTILMVTHHLQTAIKHFDRLLCVQQEVFTLKPKEVCEHFAFGLYHPPLVKNDA